MKAFPIGEAFVFLIKLNQLEDSFDYRQEAEARGGLRSFLVAIFRYLATLEVTEVK